MLRVKIAVVIPALDEAERIVDAVASALFAGAGTPDVDVVVVDGGSQDGTRDRAAAAGARVLRSEPGRARQLAHGVAASAGDGIVLLHADTRLPAGWKPAVEEILAEPGVSGGAFRLQFEGQGTSLRALEWGVRLRVALFALPYGDQAIFLRRRVLEEMGGIPDVAFMEDLDLVTAMKSRGQLRMSRLPAVTSPRRYQGAGVTRTVARHLSAALAWSLGVDRARIRRWVRG